MKLHAIDAAEGDCLLLESDGAAPRFALIDGGPRSIFEDRLSPYLQQTIGPGGALDAVIVSHIDADHIVGILDLLAEVERSRADGEADPVAIADLWHNSFARTIDTSTGALQANLHAMMTLAGQANVAAANGAIALLGIAHGAKLRRLALKLGVPLNRAFGGAVIGQETQSGVTWSLGSTSFQVVGPTAANLAELRADWIKWIEKNLDAFSLGDTVAMANADTSVPNLSSIVLLGTTPHGDILLTGDARGDHILQGLEQAGALAPGGTRPLRLLKLQHHGSDRNVTREFFDRLPANIYVVSANGKHGNPDYATLEMLVDSAHAAGRAPLLVATNDAHPLARLAQHRPAATFGYRLHLRDPTRHAVVVDLSDGTVR